MVTTKPLMAGSRGKKATECLPIVQILTMDSEAIEDLTGGVTTELYTTDILDKEEFWKNEILKVNDEYLFGCATGTFDTWQGSGIADRPNARRGVIRLHAYSILDAVEVKGQRLVKVR